MTEEQFFLDSSSIPKPAGYWVIGLGLRKTLLPIYQKPTWLHRKLTTLLLGWEWNDYDYY